jgi:hypothetical protein
MKIATPRDYLLSLFFVVAWLAPITYVGLTARAMPFVPAAFQGLHNISCLFIKAPKAWQNVYYQVRLAGSRRWTSVDEADYFEMKPFGYRTKAHRLLVESVFETRGERQREELARFIEQRHEALYPDRPPVVAVRFLAAHYHVGEAEMARPAGRWSRPPLEQVERSRLTLISEHDLAAP